VAAQFHSLKVHSVEKTTEECVIVSFHIPYDLISEFQFTQGQYLTLRKEINGEDIRRSYSLCSAPSDNEWNVAIKKIEGGRFSSYANDVLKAGDTLEVMPPDGNFFVPVDPSGKKNYVAFAAGSGITPIASILKTHLTEEPESSFKLFYCNRTVRSIILKEEIEAVKNLHLDRFEIFHLLTRESRNSDLLDGRITKEKLEDIFSKLLNKDDIDHFFLCGPNDMIFLIKDWLTEQGVSNDKIHFELFNTDGLETVQSEDTKAPVTMEEQEDFSTAQVTVTEGGKTFTFSFEKDSDNILDEAMRNGADLPYACKGGVCCTCKAKLVEGQVEMEVNYALEDDEVEEGYILTCQSTPTTPVVKINFDY